MYKIESPLLRLWIRFIFIFAPATAILYLASFLLAKLLLAHDLRQFVFLTTLPAMAGAYFIYKFFLAPDLRILAERRSTLRAKSGQ